MKIFKGQYGWSASAHSKNREGKDLKYYLDVNFAKKSEPSGNEVEGDLIFKAKDGTEYSCFFSSYEKKGLIEPKLVMMPTKAEQTPLVRDDGKDMFGRKQNLEISPEELPFY